jgi:adenylate cyclase
LGVVHSPETATDPVLASSSRQGERARFLQLLRFSPSVLYAFSLKGDYAPTFVSDSITRIFGYHPGEYLEDPNFWRERVHPDDLHRVEEEISAP